MMFKDHPEFFQGEELPSLPVALRAADRLFPLADGAELFAEPAKDRSVEPSFQFDLSVYAGGVIEEDRRVAETFEDLDRAVAASLDRLENC